jgi:hypothetical protein
MPEGTATHAPQLTTRRKVMLTLVVVALVCGGVEGIARVVWWRMERDSLRAHYLRGEVVLNNDAVNFMKMPDGVYGYRLKPGFKNEHNTINSQGFRQAAEVPTQRRPRSLRIVCLGESTTFGSDDESNYPRFLRRILETDAIGYQSYEVINAGVPGWISDQVALRVHRQIAAFKPDVAILYVGWNDFQAYDPLALVPSESSFAYWYGRAGWMEYANGASRTVALLTAWAHGGLAVVPPAQGSSNDEKAINAPDQRYRFLVDNLDTIVRDLRSANPSIRILVCTLVGLWPQGTLEAWTKIAAPGWVQQHHLPPARTARFVEELNQQLRLFSASHETVLVDTAAIFDPLDRPRLQWDFAHMYNDGYELLAWTMFDGLRSSGTVTGRSTPRYQELLSAYRRPPANGAASGVSR